MATHAEDALREEGKKRRRIYAGSRETAAFESLVKVNWFGGEGPAGSGWKMEDLSTAWLASHG